MTARYGLLTIMCAALLAPAPAHAGFTQQTQFGTGTTIAVAWEDYDNDGDLDLAVAHIGFPPNRLYVNNGNGTFTEQSQFGSGQTFVAAWGDYDNDGDADMAAGFNGGTNKLYVNNGNGTFTAQNQFGSFKTISMAWGDYDNDGDLDLAVGNGILGTSQPNYLYENNGNGTFTGRQEFGTGQTGSLIWGDVDDDGDLDLAVGLGGFGYVGQNYLYINNGDHTFTARADFGTGDTACLAFGDCDNDGDLDLAVGNWEAGACSLFVNDGTGVFAGRAEFGDRDTNTLNWGDADNDGDLDLAVGNGDFASADQNYLYVNGGGAGFTEQAQFGLGSTDGVAWGDYDNDGDLDLAAGNEHSPGTNYLYVNDRNDTAYLIVHPVGHRYDLGGGFSNRDGIGAKVSVYEAGFIGDPAHLLGFRQVEAHGGFSSQNQMDPHFGLPGRGTVDVRIEWPGSNGGHITQDLAAVAVGQRLTVHESGVPLGVSMEQAPGLRGIFRAMPNPSSHGARIEISAAGTPLSRLEIFDVSGRRVRSLELERPDAAGVYHAEWEGLTEDGRSAPNGLYLVRGVGGGSGPSGRIMLLR